VYKKRDLKIHTQITKSPDEEMPNNSLIKPEKIQLLADCSRLADQIHNVPWHQYPEKSPVISAVQIEVDKWQSTRHPDLRAESDARSFERGSNATVSSDSQLEKQNSQIISTEQGIKIDFNPLP
jgi:hypothetical protein